MNAQNLISVRLPQSLLQMFRATAERQNLTVHAAARILIEGLPSLTQRDIEGLREPPTELDTPRVSLYLRWHLIDILAEATHESTLTNSSIFRRLLFGLLVDRTVEIVQQDGKLKLHLVPKETRKISISNKEELESDAAS